jgi:hypothetical protein
MKAVCARSVSAWTPRAEANRDRKRGAGRAFVFAVMASTASVTNVTPLSGERPTPFSR